MFIQLVFLVRVTKNVGGNNTQVKNASVDEHRSNEQVDQGHYEGYHQLE